MQPPDPNWPWYPLELGSVTDIVSIVLSLIVLGVTIWIARRQLHIMDVQHQLLTDEATKAPKLRLRIKKYEGITSGAWTSYPLHADNLGLKSCEPVHLFPPVTLLFAKVKMRCLQVPHG